MAKDNDEEKSFVEYAGVRHLDCWHGHYAVSILLDAANGIGGHRRDF
jgi:hypothetical protein